MMRTIFFALFVAVYGFSPPAVFAQGEENQPPASSEIPLDEKVVGSVQETVTAPPATTDQPQDAEANNAPQTQSEPDAQPQTGPKFEAYQKMLLEGRAINAEIEKLYGSIPIGFPTKQQEYRQKIDQLKARQLVLASQMSGAAIEAYEESPQADVDLVKYVYNTMFTSINPRSETQKFDPGLSLRLAEMLTKNGIESRDIYFQAFRAAFAMQDFDKAELMLQKVEETSKTELPSSVRERLEETRRNWDQELEFRQMEAAADDLPRVKFETSAGDFVVELFENQAPQTVGNFISLVEQGFYDGLTFHLVKPGILIQGGCPVGNGTGDPGYRIPCESYRDDFRHHFQGTISMSNKGRDTGGCQFFISHQPNPNLDGKYTVFGRVIENMGVIFNVNTVDKTKPNSGTLAPTVIKNVTVLRKRDHVYEPTIVAANVPAGPGEPGATPASNANSENADKSTPASGDPGQIDPAAGGG